MALEIKAWEVKEPYDAFASYVGCVASAEVMHDLYAKNYTCLAFDYFDNDEDISVIHGVFCYEVGGSRRYLAASLLDNYIPGIGVVYVVYDNAGVIESMGKYDYAIEIAAKAIVQFLRKRGEEDVS